MRYTIIFITLFSLTAMLKGQTLEFDKRFVECEDTWVAFQINKDNSYNYGFIYIDSEAGLTFNYQGTFEISQSGEFIPNIKNDSFSIKVRLEPNNVLVAVIPESKYDALKIQRIPDWLKYYKTDTATIQRLYRWGFLYNSWGLCAKALTYLEKGQKIDSKFTGLEFELGYSYNCLQQFDKAISVLQSAIETTPNDCYLYKELCYAEMQIGLLEKATETSNKGISICTDELVKAEIAYNMACEYYEIKDKENFEQWFKKTKKWSAKGDQFMTNLSRMRTNLGR